MWLGNEPLMRQGIMQGLRPEIKRDVLVQRPTTLKALAEATAIANARANPTTDAAVTAQLAEMRAMMATLQDVVMNGQRQHAGHYSVDAPAAVPNDDDDHLDDCDDAGPDQCCYNYHDADHDSESAREIRVT